MRSLFPALLGLCALSVSCASGHVDRAVTSVIDDPDYGFPSDQGLARAAWTPTSGFWASTTSIQNFFPPGFSTSFDAVNTSEAFPNHLGIIADRYAPAVVNEARKKTVFTGLVNEPRFYEPRNLRAS